MLRTVIKGGIEVGHRQLKRSIAKNECCLSPDWHHRKGPLCRGIYTSSGEGFLKSKCEKPPSQLNVWWIVSVLFSSIEIKSRYFFLFFYSTFWDGLHKQEEDVSLIFNCCLNCVTHQIHCLSKRTFVSRILKSTSRLLYQLLCHIFSTSFNK